MTTTTYYNLNIVEGTDIVNPLVVDNPNYEKIDEAMHNNAVAGVTLANEIANATVHAITRENSECAVIRFIATSQWKAGDTATVDGVPVTALLPSGETLPDGAYVINANVLCILTGTNLTIYAERKKTENANEITFNDTTVAAKLVSIDDEIVRLDEKIGNENNNFSSVEVILSDTLNSVVTANYPSGFTRDNCIVIGAMVSYDNAMWQFINNGTAYFDVSLQGSNIQFIVRGSAFLNATAKIMLMKI